MQLFFSFHICASRNGINVHHVESFRQLGTHSERLWWLCTTCNASRFVIITSYVTVVFYVQLVDKSCCYERDVVLYNVSSSRFLCHI